MKKMHGLLSDRTGLENCLRMLTATRNNVAREIGKGKTLKDVVAARPTGDSDAAWGKGFLNPDSFAALVYGSLIREGGEASGKE